MESYKALITAHIRCKKLEKEIKAERHNLIKEYPNKDSNDSMWYITKIKYNGFREQLIKETYKFDELLNELDENNNSFENNSEYSEIINNFTSNYNADSDVSSSGDKEYSSLLNNSVPITDNASIDEEKKSVIDDKSENTDYPSMLSVDDNAPNNEENENKNEQKEESKHDNNASPQVEVEADLEVTPSPAPKVSDNKKMWKKKEYKRTNDKKRKLNVTSSSSYKYSGTGFKIFTGPRNRNKPIYSKTMLYCYETCNKNKNELKKYLIKNGRFKEEVIENIIFKDGYNNNYALIGVRGPLKIIKKKIKTLNKYCEYECISIFERSKIVSVMDYVHATNKLYINNFDLLKVSDHRNFTKLFLKKFGDLSKDIEMGCDRNGDPFAIVTFKNQDDAIKCFDDKNLYWNGKNLQIRFSKLN